MKPKLILSLRRALLAALALFTFTASAQTWQTVDDMEYVPGGNSVARGATVDPFGNLFVCGTGYSHTLDTVHALVQKSSDGGVTWTTSDDFGKAPGTGFTGAFGTASDNLGNLYYVGGQAGGWAWYVRRSTDGGSTWSTVDGLSPDQGSALAGGQSVATDSAGNVYVAGYLHNFSTGLDNWVVRRGSNLGTSWQTVDSLTTSGNSHAYGVFCHPSQGTFVTGQAAYSTTNASNGKVTTVGYWTTRRSLDGGATWATVDGTLTGVSGSALGADAAANMYAVGSGWIVRKAAGGGGSWTTVDYFGGGANAIATDPSGNLCVVGYHVFSKFGTPAWTVRKNPGGTGTWTTVDTFQYAAGQGAYAKAIVSDASGHIYVAGLATDASGVYHWIVRKLSGP